MRRLPLPSSFMLGGTTWKVVHVDSLSELGHCDRDKATIRIKSGLDPQIEEATFCHELQHAFLFMTGATDHSEKEVDLMGHLLHQFLVTVEVK